jgi:hypothetical protein
MRHLSLLLLVIPAFAQQQPAQEKTPVLMSALLRPPSLNFTNQEPLRFHPKPYVSFDEPAPSAGKLLYRWSAVSLAAGAISSARDGRSFAMQASAVGASLLVQQVILRHRPNWQRRMAWLNFGASGALAGYNLTASNPR